MPIFEKDGPKVTRQSKRRVAERCIPYVLVLPYVLLLLLFVVCVYNIVMQSLGLVPGLDQGLSLDAYEYVFTSQTTLSSIGVSLYVALASTIPSIVFGTLLAWCLVTVRQEKTLGAIAGRLPLQIPHTIACVLVVNMFLPTGMLPRLLEAVGLSGASDLFRQVLYLPNYFGVIIEYIWKETGYVCFMVLPVMSGISERYGEAASNLGASTLKGFLHVLLPYCLPTIRTLGIIVFIYSFGAYETPYLLGSATVKALPVLAYAEYSLSGIAVHRPIAMALNMVLIVLTVIASLLYYYRGVRKERALREGR